MRSNEEVLCRIFWSEEGQDSLDALMDYDTPSDILKAVDDFVSEIKETLRPAIEAARERNAFDECPECGSTDVVLTYQASERHPKTVNWNSCGTCEYNKNPKDKALLSAGRILGVE